MDPMMLLAASGLAQGLGGALGGAGGPAVSGADGNRIENVFDNSGWNVNFGAGEIASDRQQLPSVGGFDTTTLLIIAGVVLVAIKLMKKK